MIKIIPYKNKYKLENGTLMTRIENRSATECAIAAIDQFRLAVGMAKFERKAELIIGFVLDSGRVKNLKFQKK